MSQNHLVCAALLALSACAAWDDSANLDALDNDAKEALCNYQYDALGGQEFNKFCVANEDGANVPIYVGQGPRADEVERCVADADTQRWLPCPVTLFVECADAADAAGDPCASQTASECEALALCLSEKRAAQGADNGE
jgi:hypothetical protein